MKKILIVVVFLLSALLSANAQSLKVQTLFGGEFKENPNATEIVITRGDILEYGLDVFMSLTVTSEPDRKKVADAVSADAKKAREKEVTYAGGKMAYGFFTFPAVDKSARYVFYFDNDKKAVVMFMAGNASPAQIKKMIKK